jgi:hypothetical protein
VLLLLTMKFASLFYFLLPAAVLVSAQDTTLQPRDTSIIDQAYSSASVAFAGVTATVNRYRLNPSRDATRQQVAIEQDAQHAVDVLRDGTRRVQRSSSVNALEATRVGLKVEVFLNDIQGLLTAFTLAREAIIQSGGRSRVKMLLQDLQTGSHTLAEAVSMKTPGGTAFGTTYITRGKVIYDRVINMF